MKDPEGADGDTRNGLHQPVSLSIVVSAIYAVLIWVGIPAVTNFFPESHFSKTVLSIPSPFAGLLLVVAGGLGAYFLGKLTARLASTRGQRRKGHRAG